MFKKNRKEAVFGRNEKERGETRIGVGELPDTSSLETSAVERTEKQGFSLDGKKLDSIRRHLNDVNKNSYLEKITGEDLPTFLKQQINYLLILGKKEPVESLELAEESGPYVLSEVLAELTFEE